MRRLARLVLLVAIGIQAGYEVITYPHGLQSFGWWYGAVVTVCFAALLAFDTRAVAGLLRVAFGVALVLCGLAQWNLLDRAGPAAPALGQLVQSLGLTANPGTLLPPSLAHALRMQMPPVAGGAQLAAGLGLVNGFLRRFFSIAAALLVALSAAAAFASSGLLAIVAHALPVLFGGALVLALRRGQRTVGRLFPKRRESDPFLFAFDEAQERASRYHASTRRSS
jgi:hypothetical protein